MGSIILSGPVMVTPAENANSRHSTAKVAVGTRAYSEDGEFVYVRSTAGTVNSGEPVSLVTGFSNVVRGALATGGFLGVAEAPFASGQYGYVRVKGPCTAYVASGVVAGGYLELGSAGQFKALTTSGVQAGIALASSPNGNGATSVVIGAGK